MSPTRALSFFRAKFTGYIMENNKTHKEKEIYTMIKLKQLEVTNENIGVLLMSDELIKVPITLIRYHSFKWLKDVTRDNV